MFFSCQQIVLSELSSGLADKEHVLHLNLIEVEIEQYWIDTSTNLKKMKIGLAFWQFFAEFQLVTGSTYLFAGAP